MVEESNRSNQEIQDWLDTSIKYWRDRMMKGPNLEIFASRCHIDAYQTMRKHFIGEVLAQTPELVEWLKPHKPASKKEMQ